MSVFYTFCIVLILIASILLILAVLVQSPKSGMAANFGAANQVMGVRESANALEKISWWLAGIIAVLSILATVDIDGGSTKSAMESDLNKFSNGSTKTDGASGIKSDDVTSSIDENAVDGNVTITDGELSDANANVTTGADATTTATDTSVKE